MQPGQIIEYTIVFYIHGLVNMTSNAMHLIMITTHPVLISSIIATVPVPYYIIILTLLL